MFPLLHPDVTSLLGGVAADPATCVSMEHRTSMFIGQEAGRGNATVKCDRFKTAQQGWRTNHGGVTFSCNS